MILEQRTSWSTIIDSAHHQKSGFFFPWCTKRNMENICEPTFCWLSSSTSANCTCNCAVASSVIAATLLPGGRIAHAVFKLPLNLATKENVTWNINRGTGMSEVLRCRMIVWDECTISHIVALEALDSTLQGICGNKEIMGRSTLVLAKDFRQILPVILRGIRAQVIISLEKCFKILPISFLHQKDVGQGKTNHRKSPPIPLRKKGEYKSTLRISQFSSGCVSILLF